MMPLLGLPPSVYHPLNFCAKSLSAHLHNLFFSLFRVAFLYLFLLCRFLASFFQNLIRKAWREFLVAVDLWILGHSRV